MPDPPDLFDDMARLPDDDQPGLSGEFGESGLSDLSDSSGVSGLSDLRHRTGGAHPLSCPPLGLLMAYADDSDTSTLTPRRRERIREHVRRCDLCHADLVRGFDEVVYGVHEILKDSHDVNQAALRARGLRFQQALHSQIKLIAPPLGSSWPLGQSLTMAATLAVIVLGLFLFRPATGVMHAEELIERAMACEPANTAGSRQRVRLSLHVEIFTQPRAISGVPGVSRLVPFTSIDTVIDGAFTTRTLPANTSEREARLALEQQFAKHRFDWRKPFCLTCYHAWRNSLSRKRDTVTITGDMHVLRTTTSEGSLREVTIYFRRDSYRIVRQVFVFEGIGAVEMEELERHQAAPHQAARGDRHASAAGPRAASGSDAGRLAAAVASRPPAAGDIENAGARRLGLSRWLERNFRKLTAADRAAFLPNIERRAAAVRQHLVTLQRLARIDSSAKSRNRTEAERLKLRQQIELEYQALTVNLQGLEGHLNILVGTGTRSIEHRTPLPPDWDRRASLAMPHATRLQYRLQQLFVRDDVPPEETQVTNPRSVRATFEALWESIHANPD